jgi:hypothetical protein
MRSPARSRQAPASQVAQIVSDNRDHSGQARDGVPVRSNEGNDGSAEEERAENSQDAAKAKASA